MPTPPASWAAMAGGRSIISTSTDVCTCRWAHCPRRSAYSPAVAAACLAAFDVLEEEPERIQLLWDNTRYFKMGLTAAGFNTGISETPITPVIVGEAAQAHQLSRELF